MCFVFSFAFAFCHCHCYCLLCYIVVIWCGASFLNVRYCCLLWCIVLTLHYCCCLLWFVVPCLPLLLVWFISPCLALLLVVLCHSSPCTVVVCCGLSPSLNIVVIFCCGSSFFIHFYYQRHEEPQEQILKERFKSNFQTRNKTIYCDSKTKTQLRTRT